MNILFTVSYIIWFVSELLLNRLLRSKDSDKQHTDKNTLSIIWITVIVAITLAVIISGKWYVPIFADPAYRSAGIIVIIIGIILRLMAVASLGKFFTVNVTIRENHRLKKDGMYKYLRHPSYFASLISFIGFGLSLNNWFSLLLITIAIASVFIIRIKTEEKVLMEQFGSEYRDYMKTTKGFIPFIY